VFIRYVKAKKNFHYHRVQDGQKVLARFRCKKDNPKKCNGDFKDKENYCQAYRLAQNKIADISGKTKIDIANLDELSDSDKVQLLEALTIAKSNNVKLTSLVRTAETVEGGEIKHINLIEAREKYLERLKERGYKAQHRKASGVLKELIQGFGNIGLHEVTPEGAQVWASKVKRWSNQFKNRSLVSCMSFWNYFKQLGYTLQIHCPFQFADESKNRPGISPFPVIVLPKDVLSVRESKKILRQALTNPYTAAIVVLVLVCGVRTEEAARLVWDDIELEDIPEIEISPFKAKKFRPKPDGTVHTAARTIELTDQQVAWLKAAKEAGGMLPVNLHTYNKKLSGRNDAYKKVEGVSSWIKGRQNVLRHTYCSMHVAHYKSIGNTAHFAGNSERTIKNNYLKRIKPTDAEQFWELLP